MVTIHKADDVHTKLPKSLPHPEMPHPFPPKSLTPQLVVIPLGWQKYVYTVEDNNKNG